MRITYEDILAKKDISADEMADIMKTLRGQRLTGRYATAVAPNGVRFLMAERGDGRADVSYLGPDGFVFWETKDFDFDGAINCVDS